MTSEHIRSRIHKVWTEARVWSSILRQGGQHFSRLSSRGENQVLLVPSEKLREELLRQPKEGEAGYQPNPLLESLNSFTNALANAANLEDFLKIALSVWVVQPLQALTQSEQALYDPFTCRYVCSCPSFGHYLVSTTHIYFVLPFS